jgi:hypothetical protein
MTKDEPKSILAEALEIAGVDRSRDYGHPLPNHERIADIWTVCLGPKLAPGVRITPEDVVQCMIGMKLAREVNTHKRDNYVDICGYIRCYETFAEERARRAVKPA